ncbi:MAG: hypothetical protein WBL90_08995, partial [bacterium]
VCGSTKTVEIVYGMPSYNLYLEEKAGKIKLGGCCMMKPALLIIAKIVGVNLEPCWVIRLGNWRNNHAAV